MAIRLLVMLEVLPEDGDEEGCDISVASIDKIAMKSANHIAQVYRRMVLSEAGGLKCKSCGEELCCLLTIRLWII
jgi:hypothetical protein